MHRIALFGVVAAAVALVAASAVGASHNSLTASPSTVQRGAIVKFSGAACSPASPATLISKLFPGHAFGGEGAIGARVDSSGRFTRGWAVPTSTPDGSYSVTARCGGGNLGVVAHVRVHGGVFVTLTAAPAVVRRGGTVTIAGGVCTPNSDAILLSKLFPGHAYGVGAITAKTGANGRFSKAYVVPKLKAPGSYAITARCGGGTLGIVARVRVS
jgi:hypothetical protein